MRLREDIEHDVMPAVLDHVHRAGLIERASLQVIALARVANLETRQRKIFVQLDCGANSLVG